MNIQNLIVDLSHDPFNPELNFQVAQAYDKEKQTASAVSFMCHFSSLLNALKSKTTDCIQFLIASFKRSAICLIALKRTFGWLDFTNANKIGKSVTHGRVWVAIKP